MASSNNALEPVHLPYWPTCQNALTWSSEDLAVAAGEVVHILTPRYVSQSQRLAGHRQWHTYTLRVNMFEPIEWPYQSMAPLKHFSLGEELSDSAIVSLAWSPPGLALYRRSVLGILTSNLVLSFWESDGRVGVWKRTGIVNQNIPITAAPKTADNPRRKKRIRAFCWCPQLQPFGASRWSTQLLVVADDDRTILVFRVRKHDGATFGGWRFELVATQTVQNTDLHLEGMSTLRSTLSTSSPISKLATTEWQPEQEVDSTSRTDVLTLQVDMGQCTQPKHLSIHVVRTAGDNADRSYSSQDLKVSIIESKSASDLSKNDPPLESFFEAAIHDIQSEYNEKFNLGGRVRVRNWGTAMSCDKTHAATCISCHPSDMIEYGMPSSQHTVVLFAQLQQPLAPESPNSIRSDAAVREEILHFITNSPADWVKTAMDRNIVRNAAALISSELKDRPSLARWAASTLNHLAGNHGGVERGGKMQQSGPMDSGPETDVIFEHDGVPARISTEETCEICEASIPFSSPLDAARCINGHQFSRCSISFVAVQEPGVSKYCAKCGRQFLDPGKLEFPEGPSLSQALFDQFDICPYCQGKFRG
ncbi:hypothetical protein A1O3_06600 [Capronia epimyces CBS 606.96]|uniref:Transcription factor IIIC putative zinc-finger domain-containing protein n=1 Tax=Capronia epimyces CBS 606.96 TaxID=1182542 RepID=W9XZH0_9EURO|nr:uncharacterized protein A1O3_06600 [Capronia epimyces CBS 606.96]EXJ82785.1 hypothetical protein A1O3_06600 [Capronia epimyces CBS 606.96]